MSQNAIAGIVFLLIGLVWLVVPPKWLPSWLELERFARYRVPFALLTMALGAFVAWSALAPPAR